MKLFIAVFISIFFVIGGSFSQSVSLRNIITIEGADENPLLGYGIVVGLNGSGDSARNTQTREILARIANNFGFFVDTETIRPRNSAVVSVSALIPPYASQGSRINLRVSSLYDAKSLEGGELIITPLLGGDGIMYAVGQGNIRIEDNGRGVTGVISGGGIIQREIRREVSRNGRLSIRVNERLGLANTILVRDAVESEFPNSVLSIENNRITLNIPDGKDVYDFIFELYGLSVDIDDEPSVLIDSASGIIIAGGNVAISEAAVAFEGTRLNIGGNTARPSAFGDRFSGERKDAIQKLPATATVSELVEALNYIGADTKTIIKILELLHKNGNLKARLIIN
jgi:flagellar P-ring protein precursor FlgI